MDPSRYFVVPDQAGRTVVVTGTTSGLGLEVARSLAASGARVLATARDRERGTAALETIAKAASGAQPELVMLDLSSLASVGDAAADIQSRTGGRLDLLVNNGGVMAPPLAFSVDGFESQWATNVIGPTALTWRLLPAILQTHGSRVVFVSSDTHRRATLDDEIVDADVRGERYRGFDVYGRTKLADLLVAAHLQRVFYAAHSTSISAAAHPGFSATGIVGNGFAGLPRFAHRVATAATGILGQPVAMGALPILYSATAADIGVARDVGALPYFGPTWLGELRGPPGQARQSSASRDPELMSMLVRRLEQYTGREAPATIAE